MLAYEQVTGIKPRVSKRLKELKYVIKYAKIRDSPICNGKNTKW